VYNKTQSMKKYNQLILGLGSLLAAAVMLVLAVQFVHVPTVSAQNSVPCPPGSVNVPGRGCVSQAEADAAQAAAEPPATANTSCNTIPVTTTDCAVLADYIVPLINALSGAVGVVIVIMVVWGGIQYAAAKDNPQQAASAKEHIRNALFALVIYIFMVAFLNWIVPGGVF